MNRHAIERFYDKLKEFYLAKELLMNAIKSLNGSTIVFNRMPIIECEDRTVKVGEHIDLFNHLVAYDENNIPVGKNDVIISKSNVNTSKAENYQIVVEVNDRTNTFRVQYTVKVIVKTNVNLR